MIQAIGSDKVLDLIIKKYSKLIINSNNILVIGSGNGALESKLYNLNPNLKISSTDIKNFQDKKIKDLVQEFIKTDLNIIDYKLFKNKKYDLIFCTEVIEHINNPWSLIELLKSLLDKNGKIFLSTPNPLNIYSRFHYLINGRYLYFYKKDMFKRYEHTNPIFYWELLKIIKFNGLKIKNIEGIKYNIFRNNIFVAFFNLLIFLFSFIILFRNLFFSPEEINNKYFKKVLYSGQLVYILNN